MSKWIKTILVFTIVCIFCGCGSSEKKSVEQTKIFTDAIQRQVAVPTDPKRIVSMAPSVTEILFILGLDAEIVGVTNFCDYPDAAKEKTKIGGYYNPNIEAILSLNPDLVIATPDGYNEDGVGKLDQSGIPVFIVNPKKIDEVLETTLLLGRVTGRDDAAKQIVEDLRKRVQAVREKVALIPVDERPKVFYEIGQDPLITAGPGNFVDDLISDAGGINIANDAATDWPRYSVEAVIMKEPDVILTASHIGSKNDSTASWRRYRTIPAVQNGRIYLVDPDILLRSGPRIVDGLEKLHSIFTQQANLQDAQN